MRKLTLIVFLTILAVNFILNGELYAEGPNTNALKITWGVKDDEIKNYLDELVKSQPNTYYYLMDLKNKSSEQFERSVIMGVINKRVEKSGIKNASKATNYNPNKMQADLQRIYNVSDKEIILYWSSLASKKPEIYKNLLELKKRDPQQAESLINQEIVWNRNSVAFGTTASPLETFALKERIKKEVINFKNSQNENEKQTSKQALRRLVSISLNDYLATLDSQIESMRTSLQAFEKTRTDYLDHKEQKIEERINFYLTVPVN